MTLNLEPTERSCADDKLNAAKKIISLFGKVENIVQKEESAGYQHFLLFPLFSKGLFHFVVNRQDCVGKG